jgi:hypothetical protein
MLVLRRLERRSYDEETKIPRAAGESSSLWHKTFGGGLWFAYLNRRNTISLSLARGEGRTAFYLRSGFMF